MQLAHGIKHRPALRIGTGEREARIGTADVGNKETGWRYCGHVESRGARKAGDNSNEAARRSEEHTSELQSLMRISYAVFCLKKKKRQKRIIKEHKSAHNPRKTNSTKT